MDLAKAGLDRAVGQRADLGQVAVERVVGEQEAAGELRQREEHLLRGGRGRELHRVGVAVARRMLDHDLIVEDRPLKSN